MHNILAMRTIELRSYIHKIVDTIQSEQVLQAIYNFLKSRESAKSSKFWDTLTEEQKQEVLIAYEESEDEDNLLSKEDLTS